MSTSKRSMEVWTGYVVVLGIGLLLIPNVILSLFGIDDTDEVWIRIVGLLLLGYGAYYWTAIQTEFTALYQMSVWVRWGIVVGLVVLAITEGPWQLMLFAAVDLLGGLWTHLALKAESTAAAV